MKGNAKLWWKFATKCILDTDLRRKQKSLSLAYIWEHLLKRKKYKKLYKKKLLIGKTKENLDNLNNLLQRHEDEFDILNLWIARNQAICEIIDDENQRLYTKLIDNEDNKQNQNYLLGYTGLQLSFVINEMNFNLIDKERNIKILEFNLNEIKLNLTVLPTPNGLKSTLSIKSIKMIGNKQVPIIESILSAKSNMENMIQIDFILNSIKKKFKVLAQGFKLGM